MFVQTALSGQTSQISHTQSQSVEALNQKYFASTDNDAGLQESPPKKNTVTFKLDTGAQPIVESPVAKSPRSGEQKHWFICPFLQFFYEISITVPLCFVNCCCVVQRKGKLCSPLKKQKEEEEKKLSAKTGWIEGRSAVDGASPVSSPNSKSPAKGELHVEWCNRSMLHTLLSTLIGLYKDHKMFNDWELYCCSGVVTITTFTAVLLL